VKPYDICRERRDRALRVADAEPPEIQLLAEIREAIRERSPCR